MNDDTASPTDEGGKEIAQGGTGSPATAPNRGLPGGSRMRKAITGIALTLASCGMLSGSAAAEETVRLHAQVRARILNEVGSLTADAIREALRQDPDFNRLLTRLRRESLDSAGRSDLAEDAAQDTLMKIWQGRPELFLLPHGDLVRYVRTAARRNLWTATARDRARSGSSLEVEPCDVADPADAAAALDLLDELIDRLDPMERQVLEQRAQGVISQRDTAAALGQTRYAATRIGDGLDRKALALLEG